MFTTYRKFIDIHWAIFLFISLSKQPFHQGQL